MVEVGEGQRLEPVVERRRSGPERWREWRHLVDEGVFASKAELAREEGVSRAAVTMGLRKA